MGRKGLPLQMGFRRILLLMLVILLIAQIFTFAYAQRDDAKEMESASSAKKYLNYLYLKRGTVNGTATNFMNTTPPTGSGVSGATPLEFPMDIPLGMNVTVEGMDVVSNGASEKGLWLRFNLVSLPMTTVTITIKDGDTVIANGSLTFSVSQVSNDEWKVPFIENIDNYTFKAGNKIIVRIESTLRATVTYNTNTSYLMLNCIGETIKPSFRTFYGDKKYTLNFHPNWPSELRVMGIDGYAITAFGSGDIEKINVSILSPYGSIMSEGNADVKGNSFIYEWNYSEGIDSGKYNITVKAYDRNGHIFSITKFVTVVVYAVYIDSPQQDKNGILHGQASPPKEGTKGKNAIYVLNITNTGKSPTSVKMRVSSEPPKGWSVSFEPKNIDTLMPRQKAFVKFIVSPGYDVSINERAIIFVEAIAEDDPETPQSSWTVQTITTATLAADFEMVIEGFSEQNVDMGESVNYTIAITNTGLTSLNISLQTSGIPPNWRAEINVTGSVYVGVGQSKKVKLKVTAPEEDTDSEVAQITVTGRAKEDANLERIVTTTTRIIKILSIEVSPEEAISDPEKSHGEVTYDITVKNTDPVNHHHVELSVEPPINWPLSSIRLSRKSIDIDANTSSKVKMTIIPPSTAVADEYFGYKTVIKATPTEKPNRAVAKTVITKIKQKYAISVKSDVTSINVIYGERTSWNITIKNEGNGNDTVVVTASGFPEGWKVFIDGEEIPIGVVRKSLGPKGDENSAAVVKVEVSPPDTTRQGEEITLTITATSSGEASASTNITVRVTKNPIDRVVDATKDSMLILVLTAVVLIIFYGVVRRSR